MNKEQQQWKNVFSSSNHNANRNRLSLDWIRELTREIIIPHSSFKVDAIVVVDANDHLWCIIKTLVKSIITEYTYFRFCRVKNDDFEQRRNFLHTDWYNHQTSNRDVTQNLDESMFIAKWCISPNCHHRIVSKLQRHSSIFRSDLSQSCGELCASYWQWHMAKIYLNWRLKLNLTYAVGDVRIFDIWWAAHTMFISKCKWKIMDKNSPNLIK